MELNNLAASPMECAQEITSPRITTEPPDRSWINVLDFILPGVSVWTWYVGGAVALVALSVAHAIYLIRSRLRRRVQPDKVRLRGLSGPREVRLSSISFLLIWIFFGSMVTLIVSGGLLNFGVFAGYNALMVHWYATWVVPALALLNILIHFGISGVSQLLRIVRPERLPPPSLRLDGMELLALLAENTSAAKSDNARKVPLQPDQSLEEDQRPRRDTHREARNAPR